MPFRRVYVNLLPTFLGVSRLFRHLASQISASQISDFRFQCSRRAASQRQKPKCRMQISVPKNSPVAPGDRKIQIPKANTQMSTRVHQIHISDSRMQKPQVPSRPPRNHRRRFQNAKVNALPHDSVPVRENAKIRIQFSVWLVRERILCTSRESVFRSQISKTLQGRPGASLFFRIQPCKCQLGN